MPDQRFRHCLVQINDSLSFLHGGKISENPEKTYSDLYKSEFHSNGAFRWKNVLIPNVTATDSYFYDWNAKKWIKV